MSLVKTVEARIQHLDSSLAVDPLVPDWYRLVPVIATAIAAPVLVLVVVWRFEREQF